MSTSSPAAGRRKPALNHHSVNRPAVLHNPVERAENLGMAVGLLAGPFGFVVANATYAWATSNGGDDGTGQHALALYAAHPVAVRVAVNAALIGCLFVVPGLLGAMRVLRDRVPRLSLVAITLMIAGYICYFGINAATFTELAIAERGIRGSEMAAALDAGQNDPAGLWLFMIFVLGNILGTLLLAIALWRSRAVARWAALAVAAWPVLHVIGLLAGTEWFEVAGAIFQAAGLATVAALLLRRADNTADPLRVGSRP